MSQKRLERLRRRAFEAGIVGNSKMDETQLLEALGRIGHASSMSTLRQLLSARRGA
jgi:hypothetical protein